MNTSSGLPYFDQEIITLTRNGEWLADGEPITHERTVIAFQSHLFRSLDEKGWEIRIGRERKTIEVEDTAFFVRLIQGSPEAGYQLYLTDGTQQPLVPETLKYSPGRLSCIIHCKRIGGAGTAEARFLRSPFYELLSHAVPTPEGHCLTVGGTRVELKET